MAEQKVSLFELDINVEGLNKDISKSRQNVQDLKDAIKELSDAGEENADAITDLTTQLKAEQDELRTNTNLVKNATQANTAQTGSIQQLRKQLSVVSVQWARLSKEERENTERGKQLTRQKLELTNALKKEEKATGDTRRNVGNYTEGIKDAFSTTGQFVPVIGRLGSVFQGLGKTLTLALGPLGLIVAAVALVAKSIQSFVTSSEEGQDAWDEFTAQISVGTDNITEALSKLGKKFLEPKKTIKELSDFFNNSIGKSFNGIIEKVGLQFDLLFLNLKKGFAQLKGQFTDTTREVQELEKEIAKTALKIQIENVKIAQGYKAVQDAVDDAKQAVIEFGEEQERESAIRRDLSKRQAALNRQIRNQTVQNAKDQLEVAKLRNQVAQEGNFTIEERIRFLEDAVKIENRILDRNLSIARQEAFIRQELNKLGNSNREDLKEEARLNAAVFDVQRTNFEKTIRFEKQLSTLRKQAANQQSKNVEITSDELDQLLDEAIAAEEKFNDEFEKALKRTDDAQRAARDERRAARALDLENEAATLQEGASRQIEIQKQQLEAQRVLEVEFAEKIGADVELINRKFKRKEIEIEQEAQRIKLSVIAGFAGSLSQLLGEQTALGKAAAIAQTTINTYLGAQAAFAQTPGGIGIKSLAAAAAVVQGLTNLRRIVAVNTDVSSGSGASVPAAAADSTNTAGLPRAQAQAPGVNQGIVSRQSVLNNITDTAPQQILVADEVTAAQQLANNNENTTVL